MKNQTKQTDTDFLIGCLLKPLSEYTPAELKEYYEEKTALDRMEEEKLERIIEKLEEEIEDLDLEDE